MGQIYIASASAGGKTFVTALLASLLRRSGKTAEPVKLIDTGAQWNEKGEWTSGDMEFLMKTAGIPVDRIHELCPYICVNDMDPVPAAAAEGLSVETAVMEACADRSARSCMWSLIDGTGGLGTELGAGYTAADFCRRKSCPVLLVVRAGGGMTDEAARSAGYAAGRGASVRAILINGADALRPEVLDASASDMERITGVPVIGRLPLYQDSLTVEKMDAFLRAHADMDRFIRLFGQDRTVSPAQIVEKALTSILSLQGAPNETVPSFMSESYIQITDGHAMDRRALTDHIQALQKQCCSIKIHFLRLESMGEAVFSRHRADVCRQDQTAVSFEVMALFQVSNGKILSCTETVKQISGCPADRNLGSSPS